MPRSPGIRPACAWTLLARTWPVWIPSGRSAWLLSLRASGSERPINGTEATDLRRGPTGIRDKSAAHEVGRSFDGLLQSGVVKLFGICSSFRAHQAIMRSGVQAERVSSVT